MNTESTYPDRAPTWDAILPLVDLCKCGKLFEVQEWIKEGKPVNPPIRQPKGRRRQSPLEAAIDVGFHSLVQVLLRGGAIQETEEWDSPMIRCLRQRRFDLVKLLIDEGLDPKTVDMKDVFETWDTEIMEYFIALGADVETGNPLAHAFIQRIRTALKIYMKYRDQFPSFREQVNIALRYHAGDGNLKWVSLMLWAGADPYARGKHECDEELDEDDEGDSALELAALHRHLDVFKLKKIKIIPDHPVLTSALKYAAWGSRSELIEFLLEQGVVLNDKTDGGSSVLQDFFLHMDTSFSLYSQDPQPRKNLDTEETRSRLKAVHLLVRSGARWTPSGEEVGRVRRALLKMTPDYTVEIVWIMSKYIGCKHDVLEDLLRTPGMQRLIWEHRPRISTLMRQLEETEVRTL